MIYLEKEQIGRNMLGSNNRKTHHSGMFEPTYDDEGVIEINTRIKDLADDDFDMYDPPPPRMLGEDDDCPHNIEKARVDGMLESIVNQAIATRKVQQNTQKEDDNFNFIDGCEYSTCLVPTADNRNIMTSRMDVLVVPCFNNASETTDLEMMLHTGGSVLTDGKKEEERSGVVIQEEDADQVLPQGHSDQVVVLKGNARGNGKMLPLGHAERIVPETNSDQMAAQKEKSDEVVLVLPQGYGYANGESVFTGGRKDTSHVENENSEMRVDEQRKLPSSSSRMRKEMKAAASSRKHNKSEQTRRDLMNQKMKTLHDLVPYYCRTVKASKESLLTDVIRHVKELQAQVEMMMSMRSTVAMRNDGQPHGYY